MKRTHRVVVDFIDDGLIEITVASQPHNITVVGLPTLAVSHEIWLLSLILRALQPQAPVLKAKAQRSKRPPLVPLPDYADGKAVQRIRLNGRAKPTS